MGRNISIKTIEALNTWLLLLIAGASLAMLLVVELTDFGPIKTVRPALGGLALGTAIANVIWVVQSTRITTPNILVYMFAICTIPFWVAIASVNLVYIATL